MTIAIRTDSFVAPTITQQSLFDGIKQAFLNSGFTATYDDYVAGTDKIVVYAIVADATKTNGTTYLRIRLTTTFTIGQQLYSTWNPVSHTGTGNSTEVTYAALVNNAAVNFTALKANPEMYMVVLTQGVNAFALGVLVPANRPGWWNLNAWNYCFIPVATTFALLRTTTLNPFGNTEHDTTLNNVRMGIANIQTNRRDMLPGIILFTQTNQGITGRTSDDFTMISGTGTTRYDVLQTPGDTKQYLVINPAVGELAVRVA